jgi:hypothetical protein
MNEELFNSEPCSVCGLEPNECICMLAPDFPDEVTADIDNEYYDWDFYGEDEQS